MKLLLIKGSNSGSNNHSSCSRELNKTVPWKVERINASATKINLQGYSVAFHERVTGRFIVCVFCIGYIFRENNAVFTKMNKGHF